MDRALKPAPVTRFAERLFEVAPWTRQAPFAPGLKGKIRALMANGRGAANDGKQQGDSWNRAGRQAGLRIALPSVKGASTVEKGDLKLMKRWNCLGLLENLEPLPSLREALAACPMCHSREIWVEQHPNSARSFSIVCRECRFQVSLLPRAQAMAAWNGMEAAE